MVAELVAGEAEDLEFVRVFGFEGFVEFFKTFELGREAAFAGRVDDEDDFAFEGGEVVGAAFL